MNKIVPFKNRKINYKDRVQVYRNITKGTGIYSIRQKGLVVAHTTTLTLGDCKFHINHKGQRKVRQEKRKNVHAWISGIIERKGAMGSCAEDGDLPAKVTYNPYVDDFFMVKNLTEGAYLITGAMAIFVNKHGISAAYTEG